MKIKLSRSSFKIPKLYLFLILLLNKLNCLTLLQTILISSDNFVSSYAIVGIAVTGIFKTISAISSNVLISDGLDICFNKISADKFFIQFSRLFILLTKESILSFN